MIAKLKGGPRDGEKHEQARLVPVLYFHAKEGSDELQRYRFTTVVDGKGVYEYVED